MSAMARGGIMLALYALGIVAAVVTAFFFKLGGKKQPAQSFILELPTYKVPQLSQLGRQVWFNTRAFLTKAGTTIFCLSVILWAMTYYPRLAETKVQAVKAQHEAEVLRQAEAKIDLSTGPLTRIEREEAEKLAALGRMVAGVAHEINTPLGSSLTVASALQRKAELFAAEVAQGDLRRSTLTSFLQLVSDASSQLVTNLGRAAERVQSFKQVAADQAESQRRGFDAGELTGQVLSQFERQLQRRDIALSLRCEGDLGMDSYPGPFGQVLINLAVNAMTYAFAGDGTGRIDVSVRAAGPQHVELLFADDGCGMAPDVERRAFDPFFTTRRQEGASGLGLHIVHSVVVDRLGGQLRLESRPGAGTRFQLILPRTAPDRHLADR